MEINFIFSIIIVIISIVIHELSHGYMAYILGDPTARYAGRLTLNPIKHLELFGSFIVPALAYTLGGFIIGWAKPVPFNPYNLTNRFMGIPLRFNEALVAGVGPLSNLFIALVFGLFLRFTDLVNISQSSFKLIVFIVTLNIALMVFNLIPIPPLDGSKILFTLFPQGAMRFRESYEKYGIIFLILFIFLASALIIPIIRFIFFLITGVQLS